MAAPLRNDGEHVPVGTGAQVPENAATVHRYGNPARQVPGAVRKRVLPRVRQNFASGDYESAINAARLADREQPEPVEVRQVPGTNAAVVTPTTVGKVTALGREIPGANAIKR